MRIIDRRRRPGLTDETMPERLVGRQRRRENLQRHRPAKPLVQSPEHNSHPALANLLLQAVPGNPRADREADQEPDGAGRLTAHHTSRTRGPPHCRSAPSCSNGATSSGVWLVRVTISTEPSRSSARGIKEYGYTKLVTAPPRDQPPQGPAQLPRSQTQHPN